MKNAFTHYKDPGTHTRMGSDMDSGISNMDEKTCFIQLQGTDMFKETSMERTFTICTLVYIHVRYRALHEIRKHKGNGLSEITVTMTITLYVWPCMKNM